jgi:hypothetical protein
VLRRLAATSVALLLAALTGCSLSNADSGGGGETSIAAPKLGSCRVLTTDDISQSSNSSPVVDCREEHTAETFAVGSFPTGLTLNAELDDPALGKYVYRTCTRQFQSFLGGDESLVMRSLLSWAWFRPTEEQWDRGARWYRCDAIGGSEDSDELRTLPRTAKGLLLGRPDDTWMTCIDAETVAGSEKIPCSESHSWRAVTTIKLGDEDAEYPGDDVVEAQTRDFCSDSVGAWLNYPVDFDFGYTYFHEAEWEAGNRRSICWAKTDQ